MSDTSTIEWTDATWIVDRNGRRVRKYQRLDPTRPGQQERRRKRAEGLRWCRGCSDWLLAAEVSRQGACRPCTNAEYRAHYAADGEAIRSRVYARKRQLVAIPAGWSVERFPGFGGLCAYGCGRQAATHDHVVPVAVGGISEPGNLVPACVPCNSSKKASDPWPWIDRGMVAFPDEWTEVLALALEWSQSGLEACHG